MTTSLAEHAPRPKDSRPENEAALDRDGNTSIQAPCITDSREAATQHTFQDELGLNRNPRVLPMYHRTEVQRCDRGMYVRIDQAGHECSAFGVEDHNLGICREIAAVLTDFNDPIPFDPSRRSGPQFSSLDIQKLCVLDYKVRHGRSTVWQRHRRSIRMLRGSTQPKSTSACVNAETIVFATGSLSSSPKSMPIRRTRSTGCARAAGGHAVRAAEERDAPPKA